MLCSERTVTQIPLGCSGQIAKSSNRENRGQGSSSAQQRANRRAEPFLFPFILPGAKKQELSGWSGVGGKLGVCRLPASHLWQPHSAWLCLDLLWGALALSASLLLRWCLIPLENRARSLHLFWRDLREAFRIRGLSKGCDEQ